MARQSLEEVARRNTAVSVAHVRRYLVVIKNLESHGAIYPRKYGIRPALSGPRKIPQGTGSLVIDNR